MQTLLPSLLAAALAATPATAQHATPAASRSAAAVTTADVRLATGISMHYAAAGDPAAPPVVLLHGYTDSWRSFEPVIAELARAHRVYALDQRGHGDTDRPAAGYLVRDFAADAVAFLDALEIRRATVIGHSLGSLVAQRVAQEAPRRVERLVLVGSGTEAAKIQGVREFATAIAALRDPVPEAFAREFQQSTVHHPVPADFMDAAVRTTLQMPARTWQQIMDGMMATGPATALGGHRIPTLLIWGDRDAVFGREEQDALVALLPGSRLAVYEETGHAPHWERPARFAADVSRFLAGG